MKTSINKVPRKTVLAFAWIATISTGLLVLLPAISELIQAKKIARKDRMEAEKAEKAMLEQARILDWTLNDPQKDEKLLEQYGLNKRISKE